MSPNSSNKALRVTIRVKKNMPKIGGLQSFKTARRTIAGFETMLWLRNGFGFSGEWTVNDQNDLLARLFGLQKVNKSALKNLSTPSIKGFPSVLKYWKLPEIVGDVADFWCFWYAAKSSLFR